MRVGIKIDAIRQAGIFTPSQLRLICKPKSDTNRLVGESKNAYPIGYLVAQNQIEKKKLNDKIIIEFTDPNETAKWIDFGFYVPEGFVPVLVEFKLNSITEVKPPVPAEQAPPVKPFIEPGIKQTEKDKNAAERNVSPEKNGNKASERPESSSRKRGLSDIGKSVVPGVDEDN